MQIRVGFLHVLSGAVAIGGIIVGSQAFAAPNLFCDTGVHCSNVLSESNDCTPNVMCSSGSNSSTFPKCMDQPNQNCTDDQQNYGSTDCVGVCQDNNRNQCHYTLAHCQ